MSYFGRWNVKKSDWNESEHPRGKTTPESNSGSFTDKPETDAKLSEMEGKLATMRESQTKMKTINKLIRANKKKGPEAQVAALVGTGLSEDTAKKFLQPDFAGRIGVPDYALTNLRGRIKGLEKKITQYKDLNKKSPIEVSQSSPLSEIEDDAEGNRIRLYFNGKPDEGTRKALKRAGFKWAPSFGAWSGYRNYRSRAFAEQLAKN